MARAKRSLGQNFLVDPNIQKKIVQALDPHPNDTVVEIGPGHGALTRHLAGRVARLVAIELDDDLAAALREEYAGREDVDIRHADALDMDLDQLAPSPETLRVVGNIPYNITSPLLFHLLEQSPPVCVVLMVQKEVADRITAAPGSKTFGALSVGVQTAARVEALFRVGRGAFRPTPAVDSAVIRLLPGPRLSRSDARDLRTLTRVAFGQRRKQFQKILRTSPEYALDVDGVRSLEAFTGLDLSNRPETLHPDQFVALSRALRARHLPRAYAV
ncbi:MAG: 16S rRNA (adenine(1518)-N(6)/adenine(1519)-N(6))-dimethyltransferase RsmA [Gemmatimonadota bacterium]